MSNLLNDHHEPSNKTSIVHLFHYLVTLEMKEDYSLDAFISKYSYAYDTTISTGNKIDEEMKINIMSGSLSTSWGPSIVIHEVGQTFSLQNLISKMKEEDLRRRKPQNV